jgi:putative oxygen-independent coproporphyrinogen III oxidase
MDAAKTDAVQAYMDTLLLELAQWGKHLGPRKVESVFFGGGTPSLLAPAMIGSILEHVEKFFTLSEYAEITLEGNPESLCSGQRISQYLAAGINRFSIGIQSLDEQMLQQMGRAHTAEESRQAILLARKNGCANISVDLMWGLPGQSVAQWLQTLQNTVHLSPQHISAYGLMLEPGTPLAEDVAAGRLQLPGEESQKKMFMEGAAVLEENGYRQYEISNFARKGFQCRHNLGYWEGKEYLGLGPAATSSMKQQRWTNPSDQKIWARSVRDCTAPKEVEQLTLHTRILELLMLSLRTAKGLRIQDYRQLSGRDFMQDYQSILQALQANGLARMRGGYLQLTPGGMLLSNSILAELFARSDKLPPLPDAMGQKPDDKA